MAKPEIADLKAEAERVYAEYDANFAAKPRATREPELLEQLIGRLERVVDQARTLLNGSRNPAIMSMLDTAGDNLERYDEELRAIRELQSDPYAIYGAALADRANRVFERYARHFAGADRSTRDWRLLEELVRELEDVRGHMKVVAGRGVETTGRDLETVEDQITLYTEEIDNIRQAQRSGTPEERANRLAALANLQFQLYRNHFAGKPRTTRRPGLLERMRDNLADYRDQMKALRSSGLQMKANGDNIEIVEQNLEMYENELTQIVAARDEVSVSDLAGMLGGAANGVFEEYREFFAGKDRRTRDLDRLSALCDELAEIAGQMQEISDNLELDSNEKNLGIVSERRATYEREYRMILEAQQAA